MNRILKVAACLAALLSVGLAHTANAQQYPFRDITTAVVWGAGGGTDSINRMIMAEMEKALPVGITVINKTGGVAGSNGMIYVLNQPNDGYTLVGLSESNVTAAVQGGWSNKFDTWHPFIVGGSPDLISVSADAPYNTLEELVAAAKANPGSIPAAASGSGSIHHLNLLAIEKGSGATFKFVPYKGSAPSQEAAINGEVQVVVTSLAEQQALIAGGKLKPLAMLVPEDTTLEGVGTIKSAFSMYDGLDKYLPLKQAIGFAVHASATDEIKQKLTDAFNTAMQSDKVREWAAKNFYDLSGQSGDEASAIFANLESTFAWTLWDLKAAKVDPGTLGIPKP